MRLKFLKYLSVLCILQSCQEKSEIRLFNGKTLDGWEGSEKMFRVEDNAIVGGKLDGSVDQSYFLCTTQNYSNFKLKLKAKFVTRDLNRNGGISFRAQRIKNSNKVLGYQADIGYNDVRVIELFSSLRLTSESDPYPLWGSLIDENRTDASRYPRPELFPVIFLQIPDKDAILKIINPKDWNEIEIRAKGPEIQIEINGVVTAHYFEKQDIPTDGKICLQIYSGDSYEIWYKDMLLTPITN